MPSEDELAAVAELVATLQARPQDRIPFFGDTPQEIAAWLESWEPAWHRSSRVTDGDVGLSGYIGAELDESLGRCWIHGPLVAEAPWEETAAELFEALLTDVVPRSIEDHELAGDVANERLAAFASRHGFRTGAVHHLISLAASDIERLSASHISTIRPEHRQAFLALHSELFPGTYYSGSQLLEQADSDQAAVLGLVSGGELVGYAAGRIDEGGNGYVDFVGVVPARRREGHARALVSALCRTLLARKPIERVSLTVSGENVAALALYDALGFERTSSAIGYRRRPEPAA